MTRADLISVSGNHLSSADQRGDFGADVRQEAALLDVVSRRNSNPFEAMFIAGFAAGVSCLAMVIINGVLWLHFRPATKAAGKCDAIDLVEDDRDVRVEPFTIPDRRDDSDRDSVSNSSNSLRLDLGDSVADSLPSPSPAQAPESPSLRRSCRSLPYTPTMSSPLRHSFTPPEWRYAMYVPRQQEYMSLPSSPIAPSPRNFTSACPPRPSSPPASAPGSARGTLSLHRPTSPRPLERLRIGQPSHSPLAGPSHPPYPPFPVAASTDRSQSSRSTPSSPTKSSQPSLRRASSVSSRSRCRPSLGLAAGRPFPSRPPVRTTSLPVPLSGDGRVEDNDDLYDPTVLYSPTTTFRRHTDAGSVIMDEDEAEDVVDLPPLYTDVPGTQTL